MAVKKSILENVIKGGRFALSRVTELIESGYAQGDYTKEERENLLSLRDQYLNPAAQKPEAEEAYRLVLNEISTLREAVTALETRLATLEQGAGQGGAESDPDAPESPEPEAPASPAWKPWDGISCDYQPGAVVAHNGKLWQSTFAGQNVWEPGTLGTEALWAEYVPEA